MKLNQTNTSFTKTNQLIKNHKSSDVETLNSQNNQQTPILNHTPNSVKQPKPNTVKLIYHNT